MKTSKFTDEQIALALRQAEPARRSARSAASSASASTRSTGGRSASARWASPSSANCGSCGTRIASSKAWWLISRSTRRSSTRRSEKNGKACRPPGARALGSGGVPVVRASGLSQRGRLSRARALPQSPSLAGAIARTAARASGRASACRLSAVVRIAASRRLALNHKRIYRLYTEEGLALRRRRPRRHRSAVVRVRPQPPTQPDEHWAMDFMQDALADGRTVRIFTVLDVYTRECVAALAAPTSAAPTSCES
jgi:transposase InsO family protein